MGATGSSPLVKQLGKYGEKVAPPETTGSAFDYIVIVAAAPGFRAITCAFECGIEDRLDESAHCLPYRTIFFEIDEVADPAPHLAFGFFNEKSLAGSHKGGAGLCRDGGDVASNESVVGGGDDGSHIKKRYALNFVLLFLFL